MPEEWKLNYFNYYTEVEEHFQRARGTGLFMMSTLDWALVEAWKNSGIPLEAVLRGIDAAFEKWHSRKQKSRMVNSLTYCAQAVVEAAQALAKAGQGREETPHESPFASDRLGAYLEANAVKVEPISADVAAELRRLAADPANWTNNAEELEQRLTALEDKLLAGLRLNQTPEELFEARRELENQLRPYRGKMTTEQLVMLEKQFLDRRMFERAALPRLSLFYMG